MGAELPPPKLVDCAKCGRELLAASEWARKRSDYAAYRPCKDYPPLEFVRVRGRPYCRECRRG